MRNEQNDLEADHTTITIFFPSIFLQDMDDVFLISWVTATTL